jgi:hypothetical protein
MRFAAITLCVVPQRAFIVISLWTQSGNFWIHPRTSATDVFLKGLSTGHNILPPSSGNGKKLIAVNICSESGFLGVF